MHQSERSDAPVTCPVLDSSAIYAARQAVRTFATQLGFDREVVEELVIVVSELASNVLKYGIRGRILLQRIDRDDGLRGIEIIAEDVTPPFDLATSLLDGYDAKGKLNPARVFGRRGIAAGLGAVSRLSDALEQHATETGKRLTARRFLGRPRRGSSPGF